MPAIVQRPAPAFKAPAVADGIFSDVSLSDYSGQWCVYCVALSDRRTNTEYRVVLFFYPLYVPIKLILDHSHLATKAILPLSARRRFWPSMTLFPSSRQSTQPSSVSLLSFVIRQSYPRKLLDAYYSYHPTRRLNRFAIQPPRVGDKATKGGRTRSGPEADADCGQVDEDF